MGVLHPTKSYKYNYMLAHTFIFNAIDTNIQCIIVIDSYRVYTRVAILWDEQFRGPWRAWLSPRSPPAPAAPCGAQAEGAGGLRGLAELEPLL